MLTILRSVPVGQYLQPVGDWEDGLNLPFLYIREESYLTLSIGPIHLDSDLPSELDKATLRLDVAGTVVDCRQPLSFHRAFPFNEKLTFALRPEATLTEVHVTVRSASGDTLAAGQHVFAERLMMSTTLLDVVKVRLGSPHRCM